MWVLGGTLSLVPLASGLDLDRDARGVAAPLELEGLGPWTVSASQAPVVLGRMSDQSASFIRYPDAGASSLELRESARIEGVELPSVAGLVQTCTTIELCGRTVAIAPRGERAIARPTSDAFVALDARTRGYSGALSLPAEFEPSAGLGQLSILQVLGTSFSVWASPGQLHLWDERGDQVESIPIFVRPPLHWTSAAGGEALALVSSQGPLIRVDADGIELLSLETSTCTIVGRFRPVVSPEGAWAAWTCVDEIAMDGDEPASQTGGAGSVIRVSAAGVERYVGVPMRVVAIDDEGGLLLHSIESLASDEVDGISPRTRPRTLFVLSSEGVLRRVNELEPAPAPAVVDVDVETYIQAVAH